MPCFSSQTLTAARISRFVRAIALIPDRDGSSDEDASSDRAGITDLRLRDTRRFVLRFERMPLVELGVFMFRLY